MSELGKEHAASIVHAHDLTPDAWFDNELLLGKTVPVMVPGDVPVRTTADATGFYALLQTHMRPVLELEQSIAATTEDVCPAPEGTRFWTIDRTSVRSALTPKSACTGKLGDLALELMGLEEIPSDIRRQVLLAPRSSIAVEQTGLILRLTARYRAGLGRAVGCALGVQLCTDKSSEKKYIAGKVRPLFNRPIG